MVIRRFVAMLVLGVFASFASAAVVYDSFDYAPGSAVGQDGGAGWSGSWSLTYSQGSQEIVSDSLAFSDYSTSGGALKLTEDNVAGSFRSIGIRRNLGYDFTAGDDLWVSFLAKADGTINSFTSKTAEIRHGPTAGTTELRMRPKGSGSQGAMIAYDSSGSNSASKSTQDGRTYLYVCRFGDIGTASGKYAVMWVFDEAAYNLSMADGELSETDLNSNYYLMAQDPHADRMLNSDDGVLLNLGDSSTDQFSYYFDEIRYGTSLQSVLVPEPSMMVLFGIGSLLLTRKK